MQEYIIGDRVSMVDNTIPGCFNENTLVVTSGRFVPNRFTIVKKVICDGNTLLYQIKQDSTDYEYLVKREELKMLEDSSKEYPKEENKKIDILGTPYDFVVSPDVEHGSDGICDKYRKTITVLPASQMLDNDSDDDSKKERFETVIRHEIIHAFMHESGMEQYCSDEVLVSYLACMIPRINKAAVECLSENIIS